MTHAYTNIYLTIDFYYVIPSTRPLHGTPITFVIKLQVYDI